MKRLMVLFGLAGLALFTGLVVWRGADTLAEALVTVGWGILIIVAFDAIPLLADAFGWRRVAATRARPSLLVAWKMRWIRQSVNQLLPVAQIGGDVVVARLLIVRGMPGPLAAASLVVDMTLIVLMQALFTLVALGLLVAHHDGGRELTGAVLAVTALFFAAVVGFAAVQQRGLFGFLAGFIERLGGDSLANLVGGARRLDRAVRATYGRRREMAVASVYHLVSWALGAGEVYLALAFMGVPAGMVEALIIQGLVQAVRSAAFAVPGGLGLQEGGYMIVAGVLGLGADVGLAIAIVRRMREILGGVPGLIAWQAIEGHRWWRARSRGVS